MGSSMTQFDFLVECLLSIKVYLETYVFIKCIVIPVHSIFLINASLFMFLPFSTCRWLKSPLAIIFFNRVLTKSSLFYKSNCIYYALYDNCKRYWWWWYYYYLFDNDNIDKTSNNNDIFCFAPFSLY